MLGAPSSPVTLLARPLGGSMRFALDRLREWPVASQQQARRNALVAATACAQRRAERDDVAEYLEAHERPAGSPAATITASVRSAARR